MIRKRLAIFDFDGVLADSFNLLLQLNKCSFEKVGMKLSAEDYRRLFNGNVHKNLRGLFRTRGDYQLFLENKEVLFNRYYNRVKLFPFAADFVKEAGETAELAIISSSASSRISGLLIDASLLEKFAFISGTSSESKIHAINDCLAFFKNRAIGCPVFISDTVGDVKTAKAAGLLTVAVTWGFHSPSELTAAGPDLIANSYSAVLNFLKP